MTAIDTHILEDRFGIAPNTNTASRAEALELLKVSGLPEKKSEAYKYTPVTQAISGLQLNEAATASAMNMQELLSSEEGSHVVIENGVFSEKDSSISDEVTIETSDEVTNGLKDPYSLLNAVYCPAEIRITANKPVAQPVFIYQVTTRAFSSPRVSVTVNDGASLTVVEKVVPSQGFLNSYISFDVQKNAVANHVKVQNYAEDALTHETLLATQSRDSRFYSNLYTFSGKMVRNNVTLKLTDENCEGYMNGLYLLDGKTHVDNNTTVDHMEPNSYSNELFKGIVDEKATGVFNGKIYVRPDAQKTNAFQTNNNVLLSDGATIHTKPQLEIWADDVKCSHGCTSGQLDQEAIFYLRARGIGEKVAKAMILNAFAGETLQHLTVASVKSEVEEIIECRLLQ